MKLLNIFYQKVLPILIIIGIPLLQSCRSDSNPTSSNPTNSYSVKVYNYDGKLIKQITCEEWMEYDNGVSLEIGDNKTYISLPVIIENN